MSSTVDDLDIIQSRMLVPPGAQSETGEDYDAACDDAVFRALAHLDAPPPATPPGPMVRALPPGELLRRLALLSHVCRQASRQTGATTAEVAVAAHSLQHHAKRLRDELDRYVRDVQAVRDDLADDLASEAS